MSRELKDQRATLISQARAMLDVAEGENRDLNAEEQTAYDAKMTEISALQKRIERSDQMAALESELGQVEPRRNSAQPTAPNFNSKTRRGDDEIKATAYYVRTGDTGALGKFGTRGDEFTLDLNAVSNDTTWNVTTAADGGVLVPTGHYQGVIAKRNEIALFGPLGVRPIPGRGLTVNVPIETGTANVFVATAESNLFDRDAAVLNTAAMTLVKMTKDIHLTVELLDTEDSKLMDFLNDYVGRALALTHNSALITEALANGTSVALGTAAAVTAGDPETLEFALQGEYADNAAFVMSRATEGKFRKLTGSVFQYQQTPLGGNRREFDNYPIYYSSFLAAVGSGNKSMLFGDFSYMGMREGGMTFLRNPYLRGSYGEVIMHYYAYVVYKVLNADAILYGKHPTA